MSIKEEIKDYSCIVRKGTEERNFTRIGVIDLYELLLGDAEFLHGAIVIDKVVGKGAAAIMSLGFISELRTPVISTPALQLLRASGIRVVYDTEVPHIINRKGNNMCPLEKRCAVSDIPSELLPVITRFIDDMKRNQINK
jgi:iron complex outermembrane receptor protein